MKITDLPFNQLVGLTLDRRDGQEVACLTPQEQHLNHVDTVHAAVLYALAEAASGHLLLTRPEIDSATTAALLRTSEVKYRRLAHGSVYANASVTDEEMIAVNEQLKVRGRSVVTITVSVKDEEETEVLTGEFGWFLSLMNAS